MRSTNLRESEGPVPTTITFPPRAFPVPHGVERAEAAMILAPTIRRFGSRMVIASRDVDLITEKTALGVAYTRVDYAMLVEATACVGRLAAALDLALKSATVIGNRRRADDAEGAREHAARVVEEYEARHRRMAGEAPVAEGAE